MLTKYVKLWLLRAADNSITLTDKMTILLAPFSTLVIWLTGTKASSSVQETIAIAVAITVLLVATFRLVMAPYWLWRDDQADKARLTKSLDEERTQPDKHERRMIAEHTMKLRAELIDELAKSVALTEIAILGSETATALVPNIGTEFREVTIKTRRLINALSFDVPLRVSAYGLSLLSSEVTMLALKDEPLGDRWEKLQSLKKIVFRICHKKEVSEQNEIIAMVEAQNIIDGKPAEHTDANDVGARYDQLRSMLFENPELAEKLRERFGKQRT